MKPIRYIAPWIAGLIVLGCRGTPQDFVVLKNGQKLVYDVEYVTGLGGVQRAEAIQRIDGTRTIGSNEYFRIVLVVKGMPGWEPETLYQRVTQEGLYELRYEDGKPEEYLQLPLPLKVGQTWQVETTKMNYGCRVEAHEPAILPEKTYEDAYKVACSGSRGPLFFKNYYYWANGMGGPVKQVQEAGAMKMEMRVREAD